MSDKKFQTKVYHTAQRSGDWEGLKITPASKGGGYIFADTEVKEEKIQKSQALTSGYLRLVGDKQPVMSVKQDISNSQHDVQQVNPLKFTDDEVRLLIKLNDVDPDAVKTIKANALQVLADRLGDLSKAVESTKPKKKKPKAKGKKPKTPKGKENIAPKEKPAELPVGEVPVEPEVPSLESIGKMTFAQCLKVAKSHLFGETIEGLDDEDVQDPKTGKTVIVTKLQQARQILVNTFYPAEGEETKVK